MPLAVVHGVWRASLPKLDGALDIAGVVSDVKIDRDALGIPTITAMNRSDLAFGTGFAHGQDRFFQMDLSRRLAAGELQPLFGQAAAPQDARAKVFEFRSVARRVLEQATPAHRAIVAAYARGVNAGVESLNSRPWEYWVLRSSPAPWREEDTILVVHAMWWDLQFAGIEREKLRREIESKSAAATAFLYPNASQWSDAIAIPTPQEINVFDPKRVGAQATPPLPAARSDAGSNNWAIAGRLTASGGALIANDMHLNLRVPATWYRARLRSGAVDLNGVTLPGAPVLVAGSNGRIAWGFTNSYGDWLDVEQHPCESHGRGARLEEAREPGECWFVRWLATVPAATNLRLMDFETTGSVSQALMLASEIGIPHQNLIIGDREGHIGWAIAGRIPLSHGADRNSGSSGWTRNGAHPRVIDPTSGRLWSANARVAEDWSQQEAIGGDESRYGAEYDLGARAAQIGAGLQSIRESATAAHMLAIQLDDRGLFLSRWRDLLLSLLDEEALRGQARRVEFKRLIEKWHGRATADSVAYRLTREYHDQTQLAVWRMLLRALQVSATDVPPPVKFEHALWTLVTSQPRHMLDSRYASWREFLLRQVDAITGSYGSRSSLAQCQWGDYKPTHVRHPLSRALPFLSPLLDMPVVELTGDHDMPRVQDGAFGASERFAVTPGREADGYMHIAGGQSGHPLSPYYRAGFREWAQGKPLPFLPGNAAHRLVLQSR